MSRTYKALIRYHSFVNLIRAALLHHCITLLTVVATSQMLTPFSDQLIASFSYF